MNEIKINNLSPAQFQKAERINSNDPTGFGNVMKSAIDNVSGMEKDADKSILNLLQGKEEIHTTMIALQKADMSMRMLLSVRNKVIEAYREIMRMQF
ncbi:MAG: flagellar hook-basal body complex protein FliE [Desulfobacteraceae bacterium]|nr:MAG: flagellar hook-basal body complex protein FliE [Desulfobacteraceae bacterium]